MKIRSDGTTDTSGGEQVARDSNPQVTPSTWPTRERVGLVVDGSNAAAAVKTIVSAEAAGVRQVWMGQPPFWPDVMTTFAAAAAKTSTICLGTSIVPTYPRHPLFLAQQALALHDIAPGRLRLGIGPSHRFIIEESLRLATDSTLKPSARICASAACGALGGERGSSRDITIMLLATLPRISQAPVLVSTLGEKAFKLAGQIS